ncbi:MAG: hypothetical protein ACI8PZ_001269 [Myxococcota bacterium]|jgi:hypothetical protein
MEVSLTRTLLVLSALSIAGTANAQSLDMSGDCPGTVDISISGFTPGGTAVFLFGGAGEGSDVIGRGACAGTPTGLAGMRFATRIAADDAGNAAFSPTFPDGRCDTPVQVLDVSSCTLSNVDTAAGGGPGLGVLETYDGGPQFIYRLNYTDLPDGDAAPWYQAQCEDMGLRPVSCDPAPWDASYDATAFNAVQLDSGHFGCNVSSGIGGLTGWTNILTYHRPLYDAQGVCENGCTISGLPVTPICTD